MSYRASKSIDVGTYFWTMGATEGYKEAQYNGRHVGYSACEAGVIAFLLADGRLSVEEIADLLDTDNEMLLDVSDTLASRKAPLSKHQELQSRSLRDAADRTMS